jgi:hypothetical protein
MSSTTWSSNPIQLTETIFVDVHASAEGVTFGESANHTIATDTHLSPDQARSIAYALLQGADECERAQGANP